MSWHILYSIIWPAALTSVIILEAVVLVLLNGICLLQNRTRKIELIKTVTFTSPAALAKHNGLRSCTFDIWHMSGFYLAYMSCKRLYNLLKCFNSPHNWSSTCDGFSIIWSILIIRLYLKEIFQRKLLPTWKNLIKKKRIIEMTSHHENYL